MLSASGCIQYHIRNLNCLTSFVSDVVSISYTRYGLSNICEYFQSRNSSNNIFSIDF
ncbi:MAG: hypothetical protein WCG25_05060 [bacterium]